ncbi:hypothetical protein [Clostridium estertheticum]|uniref:hypothetical protein n=1 Tax=Clostridium estertheticum TaxID=238834 RepID=UPI001C7CA43A|nr:hypothetical protein [Clostridium estertheticum]MBX4269456.1 hypothetical protein [Clostridium estertheticum]WLC79206.1 hypothetical protein KTC98_18795 [Clostridium estertheticum]
MEMILLKNDFNGALNALLENMVDNHIKECKEKYPTETKEQFKAELSSNEDLTKELENIEKMISRDLSSKEIVIFKYLFNHSLTRKMYSSDKLVTIHKHNLKEWEIDGLGDCLEVYVNNENYVAVKCELGIIYLLAEGNIGEDRYISVSTDNRDTISDNVYQIESGVQVANIDICTSEGTITFTNGKKLHIELNRDINLVDSDDYNSTVKSIITEFK